MEEGSFPALPYHVPGITTVIIQSSFLLLLNVVNFLLDKMIFCGLVGQVLLGMLWGTPGEQWLGRGTEEVIAQIGYLGLILLVYEGGLSTSFASLKANIVLSTAIATTGVLMPIGLSFCLKPLNSATPLQAFAAGTALCSTSLGTTLTILSTSGLSKTRLGTVITGAAMLDDIVGLVLVKVVSNLGHSEMDVPVGTVLRPIFVSFAFVAVVLLSCRFIVTPLTPWLKGRLTVTPLFAKVLPSDAGTLCVHVMILFAHVVGASYAGTSDLFAAWVAGAAISWWDGGPSADAHSEDQHSHEALHETSEQDGAEVIFWASRNEGTYEPNQNQAEDSSSSEAQWPYGSSETASASETDGSLASESLATGTAIYERYFLVAVERLFKPLFFASIGFAIPITQMFDGSIVWRGLVYSLLMAISKLVTGLWLVRVNINLPDVPDLPWPLPPVLVLAPSIRSSSVFQAQREYGTTVSDPSPRPNLHEHHYESFSSTSPNPPSLYPASMTGLAMVARGEIGFLISSLAESEGIFSKPKTNDTEASEIYLVVTWAVVTCTIIGPLAVGALLRRVQEIQKRQEAIGGPDPLGKWGAL